MKQKIVLSILALAMVMAMPMTAEAQRRQQNPPRNGQYGRYDRRPIENLVDKAERTSNSFRHDFETMWDNHREREWSRTWDRDWARGFKNWNRSWDRTWRYSKRYGPKDAVQRLDEGMEKLRAAVNRDKHDRNARDYVVGRDEMLEVVRAADNVDFYFGRNRGYNLKLDTEWMRVRRDIEALADFYNLKAFGRW